MIKAVIFDLDDTLIAERQYIESGYRHVAKRLHNTVDKNEHTLYQMLIRLLEESPKNVFNRLFDKLGFTYTQDNIIELVTEYRNHLPSIAFFDDVLPCLELLKTKGIKTGIITDGYANAQHQKLKAVRADSLFDNIIITDELGRDYWKPHPKAFEMMKKKLNIAFEEMIYVGDNPEKDFYISIIHPIKTVRIYRDGVYQAKEYYDDIKEEHAIDDLKELNSII